MAAVGKGRQLPKLKETPNVEGYQGTSGPFMANPPSDKRTRRVIKPKASADMRRPDQEAIVESRGLDNNSFNNTNNSTTNNSNKKRRKKRAQSGEPSIHDSNPSLRSAYSGLGNASGDLSLSNSNLNGTSSKPKKKRRRKAATSPGSGKIESLGVDLADIQDDILDDGTDADSDSVAQTPHKSHMKSQPIGKLFIEQTRGFKSAEKKVIDDLYSEEQRNKEANEDDEVSYPAKLSSMAFALASIQVVKAFAHFCMGILAGLAIWQTVYAFTLSNMEDRRPFLEMYQYLSVPINSVFYIITVFCTVAAFDRYDVSKVTRPCLLKACTLQSGAVAALLYTTALCVNVSMAQMDDRLGPKTNGTMDALRNFSGQEEINHLTIWKVLSLVRAVLVGLAWFIISLRPGTDRLTKNLSQSEVTWGDKNERLP